MCRNLRELHMKSYTYDVNPYEIAPSDDVDYEMVDSDDDIASRKN